MATAARVLPTASITTRSVLAPRRLIRCSAHSRTTAVPHRRRRCSQAALRLTREARRTIPLRALRSLPTSADSHVQLTIRLFPMPQEATAATSEHSKRRVVLSRRQASSPGGQAMAMPPMFKAATMAPCRTGRRLRRAWWLRHSALMEWMTTWRYPTATFGPLAPTTLRLSCGQILMRPEAGAFLCLVTSSLGMMKGHLLSTNGFLPWGGGVLEFVFSSPTIGDQFLTFAPFAPNLNQWYHLAVRRQGNTFTAFVNGLPAGSVINTAAIPNPNAPLTIGQAEGVGFMNGRLDGVAIYNRALTEQELQTIFNAGSAG